MGARAAGAELQGVGGNWRGSDPRSRRKMRREEGKGSGGVGGDGVWRWGAEGRWLEPAGAPGLGPRRGGSVQGRGWGEEGAMSGAGK